MVKRTLAVLGILAMTLAAGTSFGFWNSWDCCGGPADCKPLYLPVDCPTPPVKTIVKTWAIKIEGPCPAPGAMCGPVCGRERGPGLCELITAIASPCWIGCLVAVTVFTAASADSVAAARTARAARAMVRLAVRWPACRQFSARP